MHTDRIEHLTGNTPVLHLSRLFPGQRIHCKLELLNPTGSFKDRVALQILNDAEERGLLRPGQVIIEASSGNTAIALAMLSATRGYQFVVFMPATASIERRKVLAFLGADVRLTQTMGMATVEASKLHREGGGFWVRQFSNGMNVRSHYQHTAQEIIDTIGHVDVFLAGAGSGGLLMGVARRLREQNPKVRIVRVEPDLSSTHVRGAHVSRASHAIRHRIEGISVDLPNHVREAEIDELVEVRDEEAFDGCRQLARVEGVMAGITTGANIAAVRKIRDRLEQQTVVTVACDPLERYLSTDLFSPST